MGGAFVFKLLVDYGAYGLDVQGCMLLRCVNRYARDQIPFTQRVFQETIILYLCKHADHRFKRLLSRVFKADDVSFLGHKFVELWNLLRTNVKICVSCVLNDHYYGLNSVDLGLIGIPRMCKYCLEDCPKLLVVHRPWYTKVIQHGDFEYAKWYIEEYQVAKPREAACFESDTIVGFKDFFRSEFPEGIFGLEETKKRKITK